MALITFRLYYLKIIREKTPENVVKSYCCESEYFKEQCLDRKCSECNHKELKTLDYNKEERTYYEKWITKKEIITVNGKQKSCQRTVKERFVCKKRELMSIFKESISKFLPHTKNIIHQHQAVKCIKKNLSKKEIFIHLDFSENYNCKYNEEVQSAHFGASKSQVSLHTVVVYYNNPDSSTVEPLSFCTLSDNLRHDPAAIYAHKKLIIDEIKKIVPIIDTVHFLSDGPCTQYRNRKMFFLMAIYLPDYIGVDTLRWHYTESGHGKGAHDGIGGFVKREADRLVAMGSDIPNFQTLVNMLTSVSQKVNIMPLDSKKIERIDDIIPSNLQAFKGTMKIHEVCWTRNQKSILQMRQLTCLECNVAENCIHYGLGQLSFDSILGNSEPNYLRWHYSDVYDSDSSDDDIPLSRFTRKLEKGMFIIVRLSGKRITRRYIANIISVDGGGEYTIKFMKKTGNKSFMYPEKDDISIINEPDVQKTINNPQYNPRNDEYTFSEELGSFPNLF